MSSIKGSLELSWNLNGTPDSQVILLSCNVCRKRKVKCDRGKPFCYRCIQSGAQCQYTPIKSKHRRNLKTSIGSNPSTPASLSESLTMEEKSKASTSPGSKPNSTRSGKPPVLQLMSTTSSSGEVSYTVDENSQLVLIGKYIELMDQISPHIFKPSLPQTMSRYPSVLYSILACGALYIYRGKSDEQPPIIISYDQIEILCEQAAKLVTTEGGHTDPSYGLTHLNLAFLYLVENKFEKGWTQSASACKLSVHYKLYLHEGYPNDKIDETITDNYERETQLRLWWGIYLQDSALSLIYDKPSNLQGIPIRFLEERTCPGPCVMNSVGARAVAAEDCIHTKVELEVLHASRSQLLLEFFLISLIVQSRQLNQKLQDPFYLARHNPQTDIEFKNFKTRVEKWEKFIGSQFPIDPYLNNTNLAIYCDIRPVILALTINVMLNDIIISVNYPNVMFPAIVGHPFSQKGFDAAMTSIRIFCWLSQHVDLTIGPLWYFSIMNSCKVLYHTTLFPSPLDKRTIAKDILNEFMGIYSTMRTQWQKMTELFMVKLQNIVDAVNSQSNSTLFDFKKN